MKYVFIFFSFILLVGCAEIQQLNNNLLQTSPYEKYTAALEKAGLSDSRLVRNWLAEGEAVVRDSVNVNLPYRELIYCSPEQNSARAFRMELKEGVVLNIEIQNQERQLFADLFLENAESASNKLQAVLSIDSSEAKTTYEVKETGTYILRIQAELMSVGSYEVLLNLSSPLSFPVQGKSNGDVWSFWGDPRDGGSRKHEGIDIFAPRGTPVLAVTKATVSSVRNRGLGGKQVWLRDLKRQQSIYYAHLDSQLVQEGQRVEPLDTIGLIGNTGNASRTRPHLHFGIYKWTSGAIDPLPYVQEYTAQADEPSANNSLLNTWVRVKPNRENLRSQPSGKAKILTQLPRRSALRVLGITGDWYSVYSPDENAVAYMYKNSVEAAQAFTTFTPKDSLANLYWQAQLDAPIVGVLNTKVEVLAQTELFYLVALVGERKAWVKRS